LNSVLPVYIIAHSNNGGYHM